MLKGLKNGGEFHILHMSCRLNRAVPYYFILLQTRERKIAAETFHLILVLRNSLHLPHTFSITSI
jgi:hypothetical protein